MTRRPSPKLGGYAGLAALGLFASLAAELPELAALAAPFALLAALGLVLGRAPGVSASLELGAERVYEGEEVDALLILESETGAADLEVVLVLPAGLSVAEGDSAVAVRLSTGERRELPLRLFVDRFVIPAVHQQITRASQRESHAIRLRRFDDRFRAVAEVAYFRQCVHAFLIKRLPFVPIARKDDRPNSPCHTNPQRAIPCRAEASRTAPNPTLPLHLPSL